MLKLNSCASGDILFSPLLNIASHVCLLLCLLTSDPSRRRPWLILVCIVAVLIFCNLVSVDQQESWCEHSALYTLKCCLCFDAASPRQLGRSQMLTILSQTYSFSLLLSCSASFCQICAGWLFPAFTVITSALLRHPANQFLRSNWIIHLINSNLNIEPFFSCSCGKSPFPSL